MNGRAALLLAGVCSAVLGGGIGARAGWHLWSLHREHGSVDACAIIARRQAEFWYADSAATRFRKRYLKPTVGTRPDWAEMANDRLREKAESDALRELREEGSLACHLSMAGRDATAHELRWREFTDRRMDERFEVGRRFNDELARELQVR